MRIGSLLMAMAAVAILALASVSSLITSVSPNPCSACHGASYTQTLDILEGDVNESIPAMLNGSEVLNVTVVLKNTCNAVTMYYNMEQLSAQLSSQSGKFKVVNPTCWIGTLNPGTVKATWQIYAALPGQDTLVITAQGKNPHYNCQMMDTYSPARSIIINYTPPNNPPMITIGGPPGTVRLTGGFNYGLSWTSYDEDKSGCRVSLYYSTDNFTAANTTIVSKASNTGTYSWLIPRINSTTVRVKADINDTGGLINSSYSGTFTIDSAPPQIINVSPAARSANVTDSALISVEYSEKVVAGSAQAAFYITPPVSNIMWSWSSDYRTMTATHDPFDAGTNYTCTVAAGVKDTTNPGNTNQSSFSWNFSTPLIIIPTPTISLASPTGGERYYQKNPITVNWKANGGTGTLRINVSFTEDSATKPYRTVAADLANSGNYTFPAPTAVSDGCRVRVTVYDANGMEASFTSAQSFSIAKAPSLAATFDGPSVFYENDSINITWSTLGGAGDVSVAVCFQDENGSYELAADQPRDGSLRWKIPRFNTTEGFIVVNATDSWGTVVENISRNITLTHRVPPPPPPPKPNHPPVASFTIEEKQLIEDEKATFDASGSSDPDGDPVAFMWDFGDGSSTAAVNYTKLILVFLKPGRYNVVLMVSDGRNSSVQSMEVIVDKTPAATSGGRAQGDWPLVALGVVVMIMGTVGIIYAAVTKRKNAVGTAPDGSPLSLDADSCIGCGGCSKKCPTGVITMADKRPVVAAQKCNACGICVAKCPKGALSLNGAPGGAAPANNGTGVPQTDGAMGAAPSSNAADATLAASAGTEMRQTTDGTPQGSETMSMAGAEQQGVDANKGEP